MPYPHQIMGRTGGLCHCYAPQNGTGSFCTTNAESICLDYSKCEDYAMRGYGEENVQFLPFVCYTTRWNIEVSCYESKTFWLLEEYRVWSRESIERLINLECIAYSTMTLPHTVMILFYVIGVPRRKSVLVLDMKSGSA